ncbi:MAG: preprotein translocase subunit SecG [Anaerolineae bacterium]|nr:preprotein translocase subunit SecG [Anaerolineae bacterium]
MQTVLNVIQILISIALIIIIMMQSKGAGLGRMFGGGDAPTITKTRRGLEKTLFNITVGLSIGFLGISIVSVLLFSGA